MMTLETTKRVIDQLFNHFRLKGPVTTQYAESNCQMMKNIPDALAFDLVRYIKQEFDSMPRNLSKAMNTMWLKFQNDHPEKVAWIKPQSCNDCEEGIISCEKRCPENIYGPDDRTIIRYSAFCKRCHPNKKEGVTAQQLIEMGYTLIGKHDRDSYYRKRDVEQLIEKIGKEV